jgi:hypothetical protein
LRFHRTDDFFALGLGGVRVEAFVGGGILDESLRGRNTSGFIHIADWSVQFEMASL